MTFGNQYFERRSKLAEVVEGIIRLAEGLKAKDVSLKLDDVRLRRCLRIVVCGDGEVGKTSLIEALFGLSEPTQDEYGFLRFEGAGMVVVETPAPSKLTEDASLVLQREFDEADYVLWTLPVDNPWAASTWDLVAAQSEELLSLSSVLLLKADLRNDGEMDVLKGHLRDLCLQRASMPLELISVSCQIKPTQGLNKCRDVLNKALDESRLRGAELRAVYQESHQLMMDLEESMDHRARTLESDKGYLQSIEAEIERDKGENIKLYSSNFKQWGKLYESCLYPVLQQVGRKVGVLGMTRSLFGKGDDAIKVEQMLLDLIEEKAHEQGVNDGEALLDACRKKWLDMKPHLEERLALEIGGLEERAFLEQVQQLGDRLSKRARHAVMKLRMRRVLDHLLMENRQKQKLTLGLVMALVTVAGVQGALRLDPHPWLSGGVLMCSFAVFVSYCLMIRSSKRTIVDAYGGGLLDLRAAFSESVLGEYNEGLHEFYKGYLPMFENMKRHIATARENLIPKQKEWSDLFLELRAVEQDL